MTCTACQRPTATGIHLCDTCSDNLHAIIDEIPELMTDLAITTAKLDATGGPGGSPGFEPAPPAKLGALETSHRIQLLLNSWSGMLREYDSRKKPPRETNAQRFLRRSVNEIRKHDWSGDMLDELHSTTQEARRLIDRPKDIQILGTCDQSIEYVDGEHYQCGGEIKAEHGDPYAQCHQCGSTYIVHHLIQERHRKTRGELMTGPEARRWLAKHAQIKITYRDIRNWIDRGHLPYVLARVTTTGRDTKLVYPGDVLRIHHDMENKRRHAAVA